MKIPGLSEDPLRKAVDQLTHRPDPKVGGKDVDAFARSCRDAAEAEGLAPGVREKLLIAADYLDYQQLLLIKASRTVFKGTLAFGLMVVLVGLLLFAR